MSCNCVEAKCGTSIVSVDNLAEGNKTKLDKCLEAVADTAHKTVTVVEKVCYCFFYSSISEECCNKLSRTVRLVTTGETAGDEDHLSILNTLSKVLNALSNCVSCKVLYNDNLSLCTCVHHSLCAVVFAVCAGECRDDYLGLSNLDSRSKLNVCLIFKCGDVLLLVLDVAGVNGLKLILEELVNLSSCYSFSTLSECTIICNVTDNFAKVCICVNLKEEGSIIIAEDCVVCKVFLKLEAKGVTHSHLHNCLSNTAESGSVSRVNLAGSHKFSNFVDYCEERICLGKVILVHLSSNANNLVACLLELGRNNVLGVSSCNSKGNESGGNV